MLMPKKVKHRKTHRGRTTGNSKGATELNHGQYGIQALEPGWITARQIEAARRAMTRYVKRGGQVRCEYHVPGPLQGLSPRRQPRGGGALRAGSVDILDVHRECADGYG